MTALPEGRQPLLRYLNVQMRLDRELRAVLDVAARDTEKRIARGGFRAQQLTLLLRDIRLIQHELWHDGVGVAITRRLQDVRDAAERAATALDVYLRDVVGPGRAQALIDDFQASIERGLDLDRRRIPQALSEHVYRNEARSSGLIERTIRAGIIRTFSAREIAQSVKRFINPRVRGGISFAAMRLGRTELNNTFHEAQTQQADRDWVRGVRWNLSRSHPREDVCDVYASHHEGLGTGVWDKRSVPRKPHPQCLCYMTYDLMSRQDVLDLVVARYESARGTG